MAEAVTNPAMSRPLFDVWGFSSSLLKLWSFLAVLACFYPLSCRSKPSDETHPFIHRSNLAVFSVRVLDDPYRSMKSLMKAPLAVVLTLMKAA
jgi:hypothetical protein